MLLYLMRHGQSTNNAGIEQVLESPLTDLGMAQVDRAGAWLEHQRIRFLYCSPMLRALQSAEAIESHTGIAPEAMISFCEHRPEPEYRGLPRSEIARRFPTCRLQAGITEAGWWSAPPEDEADVYRRGARAESWLRQTHGDSRDAGVLITHGMFGSALLSVMLGAGPCGYTRFRFHNAALSAVDLSRDTARLRFHNYTDHLPLEWIT